MDSLFSCRNCIHNAAQSLVIGSGSGYCQRYDSILTSPETTTCKFLRRKDFPLFLVDEGEREHAYELAPFESLVDTISMKPLPRTSYSERHAWLSKSFDPLLMTLAHARRIKPTRLFIETLAGGLDGRRALAHASVVRRYMANCDTWVSSYRLVLAMVQEFDVPTVFQASDLATGDVDKAAEAKWDLFFVRIGGLQEYGFHSGLEDLIWATDGLGDALALLDWDATRALLTQKKTEWMELIIRHAKDGGEFFPDRHVDEETA